MAILERNATGGLESEMRYTPKKIAEKLNVSIAQARLIRGVMDNTIDPMAFKPVYSWVNKCFHEPFTSEKKMAALNAILGGYGVEALLDGTQEVFSFVNMGDTYTPTVIHIPGAGYRYESWGDYVERHPNLMK